MGVNWSTGVLLITAAWNIFNGFVSMEAFFSGSSTLWYRCNWILLIFSKAWRIIICQNTVLRIKYNVCRWYWIILIEITPKLIEQSVCYLSCSLIGIQVTWHLVILTPILHNGHQNLLGFLNIIILPPQPTLVPAVSFRLSSQGLWISWYDKKLTFKTWIPCTYAQFWPVSEEDIYQV